MVADIKGEAVRSGYATSIIAAVLSLAVHAQAFAAEQYGQVALISDFHFNPFDPPNLAGALVIRPVEEWPEEFATIEQQAMSKWGSDTNHALLASSLEAFAKNAAEADFAIVVGDFLSHKFAKKAAAALGVASTDDKVRSLAEKTTIFVADSLSRALPEKPIIVMLGNNDSDCGDYRITPDGGYLAATRETVRRLAGSELVAADFDKTYGAGGYYGVRHPALPQIQILVVNDILWSARYRDACGSGDEAAAANMLSWLRDSMERQRDAGGSVWLVHHIPWGIDPHTTAYAREADCAEQVVPFLREPYATEFPKLLREYGSTIQASFAGHIHTDDYRLLTDAKSRPLVAQKIVPAISPIYHQNPGFDIVDYDRKTGMPEDYSTYYLANLDSASTAVPGDWRFEYTFTQAYGLAKYSAEDLAKLIEAVDAGGPASATYRQLYALRHEQLPQKDLPVYVCAMKELEANRFNECRCGR
ncbi:MAG: hypothetical protein GY933_25210 [Hyphomicrobiales bacterium]|nr:hypothetical protein [Hyphomicrobiales bacterium]